MAILINLSTRKKLVLRAQHTFGRHPRNVQTLLSALDVSQIHASIRWNKDQWEMIDHSRNGSCILGKRVTPNIWTALRMGDVIQFGQDDGSRFQVQDLQRPQTLLFCPDDEGQVIALDGYHHLLPDADHPELALSLSDQGNWVLEQDQERRVIEDGALIPMGGREWEFVCSPDVQTTAEILDLNHELNLQQILFHFNVSRDEEHVSLKIQVGEQMFDLLERAHHYCLVTLARQRLEDRELALDADAEGWIEMGKLAKMLGLDPSHVNIQIFRARHQLIETIPAARVWPPLVERKRGEVRFGPFPFSVVRGASPFR